LLGIAVTEALVGVLSKLGRPLAATLVLTSCSSAFAQDHETWRCDVPNGHYDDYSPPIWDKTTSITGRISFHKADFGPQWSSIAKIGFRDSTLKDGACHCNGIYVQAFEKTVGFYMLVDGEPTELSGRPYDTPITFKISIDPQGMMTVRLGKQFVEEKTAMLPHAARDTLEMTCSGADVSFLNINPQ
jgi:hypothetical protein